MGRNDDLVYRGRERNRPAGASDLVQRVYTLLDEYPEGMTLDELHEALRDGWLDTDAYRAYEQYLAQKREARAQGAGGERLHAGGRAPAPYGSDLFKWRAQRWSIQQALGHMRAKGTARRDGDRHLAGGRPPRTHGEAGYAPLDVAAQRAVHQADTAAHVRRERVKAQLLDALSNPRTTKQRYAELVRLAYDHLSGR